MNILLFGVSNVGKTTIGKILAKKLNYEFYDIDDELKNIMDIRTSMNSLRKIVMW